MQAYTIIMTEQAKLALIGLFEYYVDIADFVVADANITAIQVAIASLEYFPARYQVSDFSPAIRRMVVPKLPFLVYYAIIEQEVYILEVLDGRQDQRYLQAKYT